MDFRISPQDPSTTSRRKELKSSLKKNLLEKIEASPDKELFFFDESRFGTHSKQGHGWFKTGKRTAVATKLGFKNFYVYGSVSPATGEDFSLLIPNVDSLCLTAYFEEFSKYLGDRKILLILDGAGWHKASTLKIPENIELFFLPPYCPELNPVERFWQYIKNNTIKNKVYKTLGCLEREITEFLNGLTREITASVCAVDYL